MANLHKRMMMGAVLVLAALALGRAAAFRFQETENAFRQACKAELQKLGIERDAAKARYPTPYIASVSSGCLLPGATAEVAVAGKFVPGTKFIFQNDNIQIVKESLSGSEYRATLKAAPGIGPQTADLMVVSPVTCITVQQPRAIAVGGKYQWNLQAANGWRIEARPAGGGSCGGVLESNASRRPDRYEMLFYRAGESAPFEKRQAELTYSLWNRANYGFSIKDGGESDFASPYEAMTRKLADPKLPEAERARLLQELMKAQAEMVAQMQRMTEPAYIQAQQEKKLQFGCNFIELEVPPGGTGVAGTMRCSERVGRQVKLTGSLQQIGG